MNKNVRWILLCTIPLMTGPVLGEGIVAGIVKAPVASDGTTSGRITDFVINLDVSMDPDVPGFTLMQGDSIRITLPDGFENTLGYAFGSPGSICGPPLSGDECNTGVLLQGWPQHPIAPPALKYSLTYDAATNSVIYTALVDIIPDPPLEPGIKQIHLILLGFTNPHPGQYRIDVAAETGPGGATQTGSAKVHIVPKARPSINVTSTGSDNPGTLNTIYQSTTVMNPVPLNYNFLLWDRRDVPAAGFDVVDLGNGNYLFKNGNKTVGHVFIDAPDGATGHSLTSFGPSVVMPTPVFGPPSMTGRWVGLFNAGSEPGSYTVTARLNNGNQVRMFVDVSE